MWSRSSLQAALERNAETQIFHRAVNVPIGMLSDGWQLPGHATCPNPGYREETPP